MLPLTLFMVPSTTVATLSAPVQNSPMNAPFYATIGILITVVLVLVFCGAIAAAIACKLKGKAKFHEKASLLRKKSPKSPKKLGDELNSVSHGKIPCSVDPPTLLKRTTSTIGFPTQEYRLKKTARTRAKHPASPKPTCTLQRSQSLPSLFSPSTGQGKRSVLPFFSQEPAFTRRSNLNRVHTRIKRMNVETSVQLDSKTKERVKRKKDFENVQRVENSIRHKNYGVNEATQQQTIQTHTARSKRNSSPYARYVVSSLAASAKTPEPGSKPVSQL